MTKKQWLAFAILIGKYTLLCGVAFVLSFAQVEADIAPFALAFLFASLFLPVRTEVTAVITFLCALFAGTEHSVTLSTLFAVIFFWVFSIVIKKRKKLKRLSVTVAAYIVSNSFAIVLAVVAPNEVLYKQIISIMVGALFCACVIILINTARTRRAKIPWTIDQKICAAVFVTIFALGLSGLDARAFSVHKFVSIYIILAGIYMFDPKSTLVVAVCLGMGQSLHTLNLNYVAVYTILCAVAIAFRSRDRYYSIIALIFTDIVLGVYFQAYLTYDFFAILPVLAASALIIVTPRGVAKSFDFNASALHTSLISKNTINRNRAVVDRRLTDLAAVFAEMGNIYKSLLQASMPHEENKVLLAADVVRQVCENCPNKVSCMRNNEDVTESLQSAVYIGLKRGTVGFLDLPVALTMNCTKVNAVLSCINNLIKQNKTREAKSVSLDNSKMLISQILLGLHRLMTDFAQDVSARVVFDHERAELIKEELLYANIAASDCLITKTSRNELSVSVLVSKKDSESKAIERIVSRVIRHKMQVDSIDDSETAGFAVVTIKTSPRYKAVFGVAQVNKNFGDVCGDAFSFLRINREKTMMAVVDGMGAGESAANSSVLALSLLENFYKAGFASEIVMTSVNRLLSVTGGESFSALDVAVMNLSSGEVDFVKVGGVDGFIKRDREVEVVEAGSLPIGVLDEMSPKITRAVLSVGEFIVLCSDGILDGFGERTALANFINNLTVKVPQELADLVMQEALNRGGRIAKDDCTVIAAKLVER